MEKILHKYLYIGGSARGRTPEEGQKIADHIQKITSVLDELGFSYDSAMFTNTDYFSGSPKQPEIPAEHFENISISLINSIKGLRPYDDPEKIKYDIAMKRWTTALMEKSIGCIWDGSRSYTGMGAEIITALGLERQCLILFDRPQANQTFSSLITGDTSRLLTVKRFEEDTYRKIITRFCEKVTSSPDKPIRIYFSDDMLHDIEPVIAQDGFRDHQDFVRHLVSDYLSRRNSGE